MYEAVFVTPWPWWAAGPVIGLCVLAMYWLANKPLGVSSGLGTVCGLAGVPLYREAEYREPWRVTFLAAIVLGALASALLAGAPWPTARVGQFDEVVSSSWAVKGPVFFVGGTLLGFGARLAGGCTSGHSITGVAMLAPSSLAATACFLAGGALVANLLVRGLGG